MRDPQRKLVYTMEAREFRAVWKHVKQPLAYLSDLAARVCKMYGAPPVTLVCAKLIGCDAQYDCEQSRIEFNTTGNGRNVFTLAHELAHHICWTRHGHRVQDHGPMFVLVFGQLLSTLRVTPLAGWRAACKRHGVKIARWKDVS